MNYKNLSNGSIEDVDEKKGIVTGYLSSFDVIDSDNDVMAKGCFAKTIMENGPQSPKPRIHYLWNHSDVPIGKFSELYEDSFGLKFVGNIITNLKAGQDALTYYAEEIISEHSIGFRPLKSGYFGDDDDKPSWDRMRTFTEVKLYEGSAVLWGANPDTPVVSVKAEGKEVLEGHIKRLSKMQTLLRKGNLSDEGFSLLEMQIAQIEGFLKSLVKEDEPRKHSDTKEPIDLVKIWKES